MIILIRKPITVSHSCFQFYHSITGADFTLLATEESLMVGNDTFMEHYRHLNLAILHCRPSLWHRKFKQGCNMV